MTVAVFNIHVELAQSEFVWWAETPEVRGLNLAAPSLRELRLLIDEAAAAHLPADADVRLQLAVPERVPVNPADSQLDRLPTAPASVGPSADTTFLFHTA
jgi:predicted RNase H-like HicB family nuclease